ncbi:MAG: mechanosensitive ion channel domain-containing protein [Gemmatimonadaceae bacterium]
MRSPFARMRVASLAAVTLIALAGVGKTSPAHAQSDSVLSTNTIAVPTPEDGAPVVLATDTLFRLYGTLGPFTAQSRAIAVSERLRQAIKAISRGDSIIVTDHETNTELALGDVVLMTVLDADAESVGSDRLELAHDYAAKIRSTVLAVSERTGARALLFGAGYAVLATILLIVLLRLISWGFPKVHRRIEALRQLKLPAVRIQQFELLPAGRLSALLDGLAKILRIVLILLLFYIYVPLVLSFFPWTAPFSHRIVGYALVPFAAAWVGLVTYLPNLFYLVAGIVIVRYILVFVRMLFGAVKSGAITLHGFYPDWADPTYKIVRVLVLAVAATVLYPYLPGARSDAFKGVSIFVGVLFSLGSSSAIGNMVAGIVLTYTRAFQIGDRVKIAETVGDVIEKTMLVTRLRTIKNVAVTIPNGTVLSSQVINYTTLAVNGLILHTSITIGYSAPWRQVHELLIEAARRTENIEAEPAPFVLQTGLEDFYVSYELNAYTYNPAVMALTYSQLHQNIQETFNEAGVEIMSPHYRAQRDGNQITIPDAHLANDYRAPGFRIDRTEG